MICSSCRKDIADGDRRLDVSVDTDWGSDDLREPHSKQMVFCSFACLAGWASERAQAHDGRVLVEGS